MIIGGGRAVRASGVAARGKAPMVPARDVRGQTARLVGYGPRRRDARRRPPATQQAIRPTTAKPAGPPGASTSASPIAGTSLVNAVMFT